ncbi:MAG: NAD(P)/FAD-dependent oxidoreductase, partial [Nocardia sp.]|nr:NAD(P)/FAD-dependent oxidoreductase [Nocardia sp.]
LQRASFALSRSNPGLSRRLLLQAVRLAVGPNVDMRHFTPNYNPWDQRLCIVPNGDLFAVLRSGRASIVTDRIDTFTETGIRLQSGAELEADIVVTATGLNIQMLGGASVSVDGAPVATRDLVPYKGVLMSGLPNAMVVIGYTNASWTLKADLAAHYFCRLLNHMKAKGYSTFVAVAKDSDRADESMMGSALSSGYIARGDAVMPRQGRREPWKTINNYYRDRAMLHGGRIEDGILRLAEPAAHVGRQAQSRSA